VYREIVTQRQRKRAMQAAVGLWKNRRDIGDSITDVRKLDADIPMLLDVLDEAFDKKSWHGPNLRGSIRGVSAAQAAWRPALGRHNIWELTLHAAYWKYVVRRRITGEKRGSFVLEGSNFFERPVEQTEAAWKQDVGILLAEHKALRRAVAHLSPGSREAAKKWRSTLHLIRGAAAHDLYHAGQIRLLRRLEARPI
jgi:DinB family protein